MITNSIRTLPLGINLARKLVSLIPRPSPATSEEGKSPAAKDYPSPDVWEEGSLAGVRDEHEW